MFRRYDAFCFQNEVPPGRRVISPTGVPKPFRMYQRLEPACITVIDCPFEVYRSR